MAGIDFRLMQGSQGSPLQNAMAGMKMGQSMTQAKREEDQYQQGLANQEEATGLQAKLAEMMQDPEFNLTSSTEFSRLSELSPQAAAADKARFESLSQEDQDRYVNDFMMARDMMMAGDVQGGQTYLAGRITKLVEEGKRPDDTIRGFMIAQRDPEYFVQGVNQMLESKAQLENRDVRYSGPEQKEPKVGRFRSIDKGTAIDILDTSTGQVTKTIAKSPTAAQEANDTMKQLEAENKRQEQIDSVLSEQDAITMAQRASTIAGELASDDGLSAVVGGQFYLERTPTLANSQAVINKAQELASLVTKDNLSLMSGVLTQKDIEFLGRISSGGLNITENGILGNYEQVKKDLTELSKRLATSTADKQPGIDKRLFTGKKSGKLGRAIKEGDVSRLRAAGFSTRQIYNMLQVE